MRFTLTIDTDNAAFDNDPHIEVSRLLRVAAARVDHDGIVSGDTANLRDTNGNTCGRWAYGVEVPA